MAVRIGSARIDENGNARGGRAGDQTGREVGTQSWYKHNKGWRVFRAKSAEVAEKIAQDMQWACENKHIGYDQGQRLTLYNVSKPLGFNCRKVTTNCETDCSALVRVCCAYAGVMLPNFRTPTEPAALLDSGAFTELKGAKYTDSSAYLKRGDILVTKTQGHTVVVLTNGPKAGEDDPADTALRRGDEGAAVKAMQQLLLRWDPNSLPEYGADGEFGEETEAAVKAFQKAVGLPETGVYDAATEYALRCRVCGYVEITGDSVNVRSAPGTGSQVMGVVHRGDRLIYQQEVRQVDGRDWYMVEYENQNGWVSSKYAALTDGDGKRGEKIVDISHFQEKVDYDALIADTALIILQAGYRKKTDETVVEIDPEFKKHADGISERGVRFGAYFYSIADTEVKAREEARKFWEYANAYKPLFWAMDAEASKITKAAIVAFTDELRRLGAGKVGCYCANHRYKAYGYDSIRDKMDFTWIPYYKTTPPKHPCDLWQYTDEGCVNGIDEGVDLSRVTGQGHDLEWFCGGGT